MTLDAPSLFVVMLPTLECNLGCDYCFEEHPRGRWSEEGALEIVDSVVDLARHIGARHLRLHWQGGEALLMGLHFWSRVLAEAEERASRADVTLAQSMQTNLTLYTSRLAPLVHDHLGGRLGTSFEPTGARHYPSDHAGQRFRRAWRRAFHRAEDDGVAVGVLSLLSEKALEMGATRYLDDLHSFGIRRLRINLPFEQSSEGRGYWLDPAAAGHFLADAYGWWADHGRDDHLHLKPMAWIEAMMASGTPPEPGLCIFASNCADVALSITTRGDVTLCDSLAASDRFPPYGNLFEQPLRRIHEGETRRRLRVICGELLGERCAACRYLPLCHGGCLVRSRPRSEGGPPEYHYCETYRTLFTSMERRLGSEPS